MRITFLITLLFAAFLAFGADSTTEIFTLDHQMSQHCEKKIKENLRFEKGISKIDVSLKENTITITFNPEKTNTDKIIRAFKKIGFNAIVWNPQKTTSQDNCFFPESPCENNSPQVVTGGCCGGCNL